MDNQEDVVETERQRKYESSKETEPADEYSFCTKEGLFVKRLKETRKALSTIVTLIDDLIDEFKQQNLFEADEK